MPREDTLPERLSQVGIFLLLLLSADAVFVAVHLVYKLSPFIDNVLYSIETDRGYSEIFQYVKMYWIVVMLAVLWWRTREGVYVAWLLLFAYFLCDDALKVHENAGRAIAVQWHYPSALGLRGRDFGELVVSIAAGSLFLALVLAAYLRSAQEARQASRNIALLVGMLAFFGVFVDTVHIVVGTGAWNVIFGTIEDGGEMFAVSLVCWYVFGLLKRDETLPAS